MLRLADGIFAVNKTCLVVVEPSARQPAETRRLAGRPPALRCVFYRLQVKQVRRRECDPDERRVSGR